ncbi:MAG: sodium:alanine symporter family protein, partial [Ruminococcus sp.]|nr:sodium:alanine symporter family protein [Ruminococcus sp.]
MTEILERISSFVWGGGLIFLLLFTGAVYTIKLRFIQFSTIPYLLKNARKNQKDNNGLSQWKTVC